MLMKFFIKNRLKNVIFSIYQTPLLATVPVAIIGCLLALIFGIDSLADFLSLGTLIAYSMSSVGVILLRYSPPPETVILSSSSVSMSQTDSEKEDLAKTFDLSAEKVGSN